MPRTSPSVDRIVSLLNFFLDHPGKAATLTTLINFTGISRATCYGAVTSLVKAGYLHRMTDKSYILGPALIHLGEIAQDNQSSLKVAEPIIRMIAAEFEGVCSIASRDQYDVILQERAAAVARSGLSTPPGSRVPLLAQYAPPYFAGSSAGDVEPWIEAHDPQLSAGQIEALRNGIAQLGRTGFLFFERSEDYYRSPFEWLDDRSTASGPTRAVIPLDPETEYDFGFVVTPVFGRNRLVEFALTLQSIPSPCRGTEILRIGTRLMAAAEKISSSLRRPRG